MQKKIKAWFNFKGIERINSFGYGEEYPLIKCKDCGSCTEDEHAMNRRLTIRVIK